MLSFIGLCLGIALLAAALTGPFVYFAFVPAERRKREAAERREGAWKDALGLERATARHEAEMARVRIEQLEAELFDERKTDPVIVPEIPRRARTDTLVSE